jgi:hypothetical protein
VAIPHLSAWRPLALALAPTPADQAPASKALFYGCGLGTLVSSLLFKSNWSGYDVTAFAGARLHRLVAGQLLFGSVGELLLGLGLVYHFRLFERRMGTSQFVSFTFCSTLLSLGFQVVLLALNPGQETLTRIAPGLYSVVFALFVPYFALVPKLNRHRILGVELSDKSLVYLWGSQLLLSRGRESLATGLCGLLGGLLCLSESLPFRKMQLPASLRAFGKSYLAPLLSSRSPLEAQAERERAAALRRAQQPPQPPQQPQGLQQQLRQQQRQQQGAAARPAGEQLLPGGPGAALFGPGMGMGYGMGAAPAAPPQPSEEDVATLVALGFDRALALRALRLNGNNVQHAADSLFSQH